MSSWPSWLDNVASSHRLQLVLTAAVSAGIAATAVLGLQRAQARYEIHDLKDLAAAAGQNDAVKHGQINEWGGAIADPSSPPSTEDERGFALAKRARMGDYDDDLILEQLARNRVFLGDEGLSKLRKAFIIVVGCGGVGSHAAAALARSGCGKLRLIDFDQVTLSSLNRHAVATLADVGTPKVVCLRKRLEQIVPWTHFDCRNQLFGEKTATTQLEPWTGTGQKPDYVIDAIDNIESKVALLHYCSSNGIPVISSMGAGCKSDPTRIFVGDISASTDDPLSRTTRRKLRAGGVKSGIPVVFSSEKTAPGKAQLLPLPEEEFARGKVAELGVLPDFRVRILPVLGTMPATFGLCVANHVILELAGYPHDYITSKGREKMYDGILAQLQGSEERLARQIGIDSLGLRIPVSSDDVGYLVDEVYRGRSVVSGLTSRLALVRWRKPRSDMVDMNTPGQKADQLFLGDLVCMTKDEVARHEKLVFGDNQPPEEVYDAEVVRLVEQRMEEERSFRTQKH